MGGATPTPTPTQTLASVTNENIGEYINLGNDIVDYNGTTGVMTDDWRILYVENDTVYAILSSYLPAEDVPTAAGLDTDTANYPYNVWSDTNRDTLLAGLTHSTAWNGLANGIEGATVTGTPTAELLMKSYNQKNNLDPELNYEYAPKLDSSGTNNLYVPHTSGVEECYGYWLASSGASYSYDVWDVLVTGQINLDNYYETDNGTRPIVSLPSTTPATKVDGIWTVTQ